jgi:hypothetical protein
VNKNQFKSELIYELLLLVVFNLFYFIMFTPPSNIVFFSIDTRMMSDEIIQILKPSSFFDFIYDVAYGGRIIWGRFFHYFYAPIVFTLNLIFGNYLSLTQIIIFINYNFLFVGLVILGRIYIKSNLFRYSIIGLLLTFEISSIIDLKTTSQEIFIISLIIYFLNKDPKFLNKQQVVITAFLTGILCGIKFTNAPYAIVLFINLIYKKNKHAFRFIYSSVAGFLIAQPSLLIPKVLDLYIDDIFHHLNYSETTVSNFDWLKIIYLNYGKTFLIIFITLVLLSIKNFKLIKSTHLIFIAAFIQLGSYFFSDGLIRAHYTKLPIIIIFFYLFNIFEKNKFKTIMNFFVFIYIFIGIYDNFQRSYDINLYKYKSIEKIDNMYENKPEVILMYEVFEFVEKYSRENNIPLVWWSDGTPYYPYSDFHWTSFEEPEDYNFYIKEMFERFEGFVKGNCSNYGGIAVNYKDSIDLGLEKILLQKDFKFLKQFDQNNGNGKYFYRVYAAVQSGIPNDC